MFGYIGGDHMTNLPGCLRAELAGTFDPGAARPEVAGRPGPAPARYDMAGQPTAVGAASPEVGAAGRVRRDSAGRGRRPIPRAWGERTRGEGGRIELRAGGPGHRGVRPGREPGAGRE